MTDDKMPLPTLAECRVKNCPRSWNKVLQGAAVVGLCFIAALMVVFTVGNETSVREVLFLIGGAIAYFKLDRGQAQIIETQESTKKEVKEDIKAATSEAAASNLNTVTSAAVIVEKLEVLHGLANGATKEKVDKARQEGFDEGQKGSKF